MGFSFAGPKSVSLTIFLYPYRDQDERVFHCRLCTTKNIKYGQRSIVLYGETEEFQLRLRYFNARFS